MFPFVVVTFIYSAVLRDDQQHGTTRQSEVMGGAVQINLLPHTSANY